MDKKYSIKLILDKRLNYEKLAKKGNISERKIKYADIFIKADGGEL